jgi:gliding motility-associated-like protein
VIYDRWGLKVFETQDINTKGWDGSYNGKDADAAVFYYIFNYELLTGETGIKKGNISLLK